MSISMAQPIAPMMMIPITTTSVWRAAEGAARSDVSAGQGDCRIGTVHLHHVDLGGVDTEVVEHAEQLVVGHVAHRHSDELERQAAGHRDHPGNQSLGVGDVHVAGGHRLAHLVAVAEGPPFHLDAKCRVPAAGRMA